MVVNDEQNLEVNYIVGDLEVPSRYIFKLSDIITKTTS